jgi:prolyl oligopeptidase
MTRTTPILALLMALALPPALAATAASPAAPTPMTAPITADTDPHLWLEDVSGERALAWVRERNAATETALMARPGFAAREQAIREVLDSRDRIPAVTRIGGQLYNLWIDAANPRGLWRRTTLEEYRKPQPAWETVLDLDALGKAEGENWVWGGATCHGPAYRRCLLQLSRGGADATVVREFDLVAKGFVAPAAGGFVLPEAKSLVAWADADTVWVGTDFGPGSLTASGYARIVKRWKRGTPLAEARTVYEGRTEDVYAFVNVDDTPGFERTVIFRAPDFYSSELSLLQGERLVPLPKPRDASLRFWRRHVLLDLRSDWQHEGQRFPRGALLVAEAQAYLEGRARWTALFTPTATRSLETSAPTRSRLMLNVLDNVANRLEEWTPPASPGGSWTRREVQAPHPGQLSLAPLHDPLLADDPLAEHYLLSSADFLQPDTLWLGRSGQDGRERLKSRPRFFDAEGMRVEQRFATSADGTRVPYFVVWPRGARADGTNPTLLYGYGGFEVAMTPWYSGGIGRAWTGQGGVFVLANIRGGGEFGPAWHQAALLGNRQKSFDDFIAVAEALVRDKVTSPRHLGIEGGSNGGLLVGAVMLQRPELFGAVVCQVPLLDMRRYHRLLAGASWMAEYGDPDKPEHWAFLSRYSPYHNVKPTQKLPPVLFVTSTRDDRVHPGHARKMAARMLEQGHRVWYWENIEGGHGGAADNAQRARMQALEYAFLWQQLAGR